jgi:hypothetical protein
MVPLPTGSAVWLIVCWLLVWRVTSLLCYESGPFEVLTRLRRILASAGLQRLVSCFHCAAIWVSLVFVGILFERRWSTLFLVVAVAGATSITERWLMGGQGVSTDEEDHV